MTKPPPDNPEGPPEPRRGGYRANAKRPVSSGKYGEPTELIRVPVSLLPVVKAWLSAKGKALPTGTRYPASAPSALSLPLFSSRVPAGFPSPADDHQEDSLDLQRPPGQKARRDLHGPGAGKLHGRRGHPQRGLLIVDRSLEPKSGDVVIAVVNGELTVKRLKLEGGGVWLMPENPGYQPLEIRDGLELTIWGVVAHVVHSL